MPESTFSAVLYQNRLDFHKSGVCCHAPGVSPLQGNPRDCISVRHRKGFPTGPASLCDQTLIGSETVGKIRQVQGKLRQAAGLAALLTMVLPVAAQKRQSSSNTNSPAAISTSQPQTGNPGPGSESKPASSNDRILWALPNYLTVENADHVPPLTAKGKFRLTAKDCFDPVEFPFTAILAGIGQAQNSEPSYGQGLGGYGKRFALAFADNTLGNFVTEAVFPSMLRQDPRYYRLGKGSFDRRTGYVFSRMVITRSDSGQSQFNYSEIAGNAAASELSLLYHPADERHFSNALGVWGTQIVWDGIASELKEFWPDMHARLSRKKKP